MKSNKFTSDTWSTLIALSNHVPTMSGLKNMVNASIFTYHTYDYIEPVEIVNRMSKLHIPKLYIFDIQHGHGGFE